MRETEWFVVKGGNFYEGITLIAALESAGITFKEAVSLGGADGFGIRQWHGDSWVRSWADGIRFNWASPRPCKAWRLWAGQQTYCAANGIEMIMPSPTGTH